MDMSELSGWARKQLSDLTGLEPVSVTRVFKEEDGWHIAVEMLEMTRIPNSTDVLGCYEAVLTEAGDMVRFDRKRTRLRAEAVEDQGE